MPTQTIKHSFKPGDVVQVNTGKGKFTRTIRHLYHDIDGGYIITPSIMEGEAELRSWNEDCMTLVKRA